MLMLVFAALLQTTTAPPIKTLDRGTMSQVDSSREVVVRSAPDWRDLWRAHAPNRLSPGVDFSTTIVVAVFLGTQPTAGYTVDIARTRVERGALVVEYIEKRPGPDAIAAQILTSPFHIVALPAHAGEVRFEKVPK